MNVLELLVAADELDLQKLIEYVQLYLFDKKIGFLTDNYLEILKIVFRHEELSKLREFCLDRVAEDPGVLFRSPNFYTLDKSLLYLILQQENLAINEMEICKFMIQWAITQSSMIINIDDILELSSEDLDSKLLEVKHFAMISNWIDRNNTQIYKTQFPYKFKLLYRASEDGFDVENFHILCDKKGPTVTISKFAKSGKIIGGYNPLDWGPQNETIENTSILDCHSWWATSESFLFCFENKKTNLDSQWAKFARVASVHSAICYNRQLCGPAFGPGWDLVIGERYKHASCWGSTGYPGSRLFFNSEEWNAVHHELEDYEVFQKSCLMNPYALNRIERTSHEESNEIASTSTIETNVNPEVNSESNDSVSYTLDNSEVGNLIGNIPESTTSDVEPSINNNTSGNTSINRTPTIKLGKNDITQIDNIERKSNESDKGVFKRMGKLFKKRIKKIFK
ncbi:24516_t:CDS:2 [Cetraspora pellucida]|uniref:24516_t:CDS:1 n=1 Tax=Cetraspora pellucida TaxID=1433469 RepID=A0A9N9N565_9GLOM|nr:24516_t:CDS:2 [Cetraspora pellucida]